MNFRVAISIIPPFPVKRYIHIQELSGHKSSKTAEIYAYVVIGYKGEKKPLG